MKSKIILAVFLILALTAGIVSAQNAADLTPSMEPTQTPYIIYVVVTATPEPEPAEEIITKPVVLDDVDEETIVRPMDNEPIKLVNGNSLNGSDVITITNPTTSENYAETVDDLVQRIVATVVASTTTTAGGSASGQTNYSSNGGAVVRNDDGTTCTMNFELVSEPTYPAGSVIPRGVVFWKEWVIRNTGTCTWTPSWEFVFSSGWQIGNTRFHMNRTTAPGETLTVRLGMVPDQKQNGNYYSTYAFEAPDGTQFGTITSSYTVQDPSYFTPKPTIPSDKLRPQPGRPAGPEWPFFPPPPPPKK